MGFGGSPKVSDPVPPPEPLKYTDEEMQATRDDAKRRAAAVAGMLATNKTGGLSTEASTTKKTALGA